MKKVLALLACAASLLAGGAASAQSPNAPLEFNYGLPAANHASVYVAQDLGLFEKVGLKPKFFFFQSGAPLLAGIKGGSLDVITAGLAVVFALGQDIPLKFLFWEANSATSEGLNVDPAAGIKSYADLAKIKKIGAATGTCAQVSLYLMAEKLGIDYSKLDVVNVPAPLFRNAFKSGSIQAGVAWPPFSLQLQSEGYPVASFDADYTPPGGMCPGLTGVRPDFQKAHPDIGLRLAQAEALARKAIKDNPKVAIDAYVKRLGVSPEVAKATVERECCGGIPSFETQLDPASPFSVTSKDGGLAGKLFKASEILANVKAIPAPVPMETIRRSIDPSALQAYQKSIGK
ncbi:MAG: ABC transporter substrate-binding protein [Hyphomicrobiales bacterium]|nr:ABC transporter substrate-binding protein [Hyphomicrobiales bacterium]